MVGIFSRFSSSRNGHRRSQSALDGREALPPNAEIEDTATAIAVSHGIEIMVEFKPVERPVEPLESDQPVKCPLLEPSILNDGRMWNEWLSANVRRRADVPFVMERAPPVYEVGGSRVRPVPTNRFIAPSLSAPEHHILKLLEECNAAGD
ncbi:uncharacterized protein LOC131247976 [Magnolia sinica]|uniref:uncharacterized protein LOC131247976 n=1 Tax=Magnolia sinica TaxID=86752 RepID=UPI002659B7A4|nr:uncharacterized protein LOC131247976 [Magnolia sinica]